MEKTEKKFLTAKEAKELADTSNAVVNHVYKAIKEVAKENQTRLNWCIEGLSDKALSNLMKQLSEDGYRTYITGNYVSLDILWN